MKKMLAILSLLAVAGCATANKPYPLVETSSELVRNCRQVARFHGPEGYRMWGPPAVIGDFKYESAVKAKAMGATHIHWRVGAPGMDGSITGWAYDCTGILDENASDREDYR